jgi:hypothetical protein
MVSGQPKPPTIVMKEILKKNPMLKLGSLPHTSQLAHDKGEYQ